jgi:hypothetical protein
VVDRVLTLRELNRGTLTRQMLLDREALPSPRRSSAWWACRARCPNLPT